jgi:hypothetical protein
MLRVALEVCQRARRWNESADAGIRAWLTGGVVSKVFLDMAVPYLTTLEPAVKRFQTIQERLLPTNLESKAFDLHTLFIAEFKAFVDEATAHYQFIKSMVDAASAPRHPADPAKVEANEQAFERGETRPLRPGFLTGRPA